MQPQPLPRLLLCLALAACAGEAGKAEPGAQADGGGEGGPTPGDSGGALGDGASGPDCAAFPLDCDGIDNDCDGEVDEGAELEARALLGEDRDGDRWAADVAALGCATDDDPRVAVLGDGDCDDADDAVNPAAPEACFVFGDEDCDGRPDCADEACTSSGCRERCDDGEDNDRDGEVDCRDVACSGDPACAEDCADGLDNNADGRVDCADPVCSGPACAEDCADAVDNDGDRAVDCADPDCAGVGCAEACADGLDNDLDGAVDCDDPDCFGSGCPEDCAAGAPGDEDRDGLANCEDADCASRCTERCDGRDGDSDGLTGCADPDCGLVLACWAGLHVDATGLQVVQNLALRSATFVPSASAELLLAADTLRISGTAHTASGAPLSCAVEIGPLYASLSRMRATSWSGGSPLTSTRASAAIAVPADPLCPAFTAADLAPMAPGFPAATSSAWGLEVGDALPVLGLRQAPRAWANPNLVHLQIDGVESSSSRLGSVAAPPWARELRQSFTGSITVAPIP